MKATPPQEAQREMLTLVSARVRDVYLRKPFVVDGGTDLVTLCRALREQGGNHALVRDDAAGERLGIFTTTDLRDALLRGVPPEQLAVRDVARFPVLEVQADAELFEALWLMVKHRVHRLLVRDGEAVLGVLGQLDLVSFVANHSHLIALQIDEAADIGALQAASARVDDLIALLHGSGIRIERITRLVTELNRRLFARCWQLVAPAALRENSCLLVMGSEGRGEQILKTDQDNALLLRDGYAAEGVGDATRDFSAALQQLGYPPCPGGIMVTTPVWCQPLAGFKDSLREWIYGNDAEGPMQLAIFFDAAAVAGDAGLLDDARAHLDRLLVDHQPFLARFAAPADQFAEPGNWFTRLTGRRHEQPLDLKKLGTFPIVHGVRALALARGVRELGTLARIERLQALGELDAELTRDLGDALHFLMALRLAHQLRQRAAGARPGNEVRPSELGALEREPLLDALAIVRRFRALLRQRFRLDSL